MVARGAVLLLHFIRMGFVAFKALLALAVLLIVALNTVLFPMSTARGA